MFINIKSDYSTAEIERILSSKRNVKYMRKYVDYDIGINWVSHRKNLLCLFYNFGTKSRDGYQSMVRPYFYGRVFKTKKGNRIIGIALPEITFLLLSLVIFIFCAADMVESFWLGLGGCIFALFVFVLFNLDMPSGISRIKDYLEKQFKSEYD